MDSNVKVSIAIPCYEMHGNGGMFLDFQLDKISKQTYKNIEVVISDHSTSNLIYDVVKKWSDTLTIKYVRHDYKVGSSSANVNVAINNCTGDIIKIIFQDDFLYDDNSIAAIVDIFDLDNKWLVTTCLHTSDGVNFYNRHVPRWNNMIHRGVNTISSPSVLTIRNDVDLRFDEDLIWLMDVDIYKRLYDKYGLPMILDEVTVVNRLWDSQLSNTIPQEIKNSEVIKLIKKYETS